MTLRSRIALSLALLPSVLSCKSTARRDTSELESAPLRANNCGNPLDKNRANPNHCEGPFTLDGSFNLRPEALKDVYRFYIEDENDKKIYQGQGVAPNRFGMFLLKVPSVTPLFTADGLSPFKPVISDSTGQVKYFREHHYHLGDNRVGMRLLPIVDREGLPYGEDGKIWTSKGEEKNPYFDYDPQKNNLRKDMGNGVSIYGSEVVDSFLRKSYGAQTDDERFPIFALSSYIHPEQFEGTLLEILKQKYLKTEAGTTHLGAYIGKGMTRNSPRFYHGQKWEVAGYPATIATITMDGVQPEVLNQNILTTLEILNRFGSGVVFPDDYKFDRFRAINLKETFEFFRGWVDHEWVRPEDENNIFWTKDDLARYTPEELAGIAELVGITDKTLAQQVLIDQIYEKQKRIPFYQKLTQIDSYRTYCAEHLTIVLNIALNLPQNQQGYVEVWGPEVGNRLWTLVNQKYKNELGMDLRPASSFAPLWKRDSLPSPTQIDDFGKGMVWPIKTTADIMSGFLENYLNWTDKNLSPYYSIATIVGMMPEALRRMKIKPEEYLDAVVTPIYLSLKHSFTMKRQRGFENFPEAGGIKRQALLTHLNTVTRGLLWSEMKALEKQTKLKVADRIVEPVMKLLTSPESLDYILKNPNTSASAAWDNYRNEAAASLQKMREHPGGTALSDSSEDTFYVLHYSPPAVVHHIASNMYPAHPLVKIQEVATVMDAAELCAVNRPYTVFDPNQKLPDTYRCEDAPR